MLVVLLLAQKAKRFTELREEIDGVSQRMLTRTLRGLERAGLVSRKVHAKIPPRVEYALTPLGLSLCEPIVALGEWVIKHVDEIEAAQRNYRSDTDVDMPERPRKLRTPKQILT